MNFRFAHYDPPKKKTVRTTQLNGKPKVPHRPASTPQSRRRPTVSSKGSGDRTDAARSPRRSSAESSETSTSTSTSASSISSTISTTTTTTDSLTDSEPPPNSSIETQTIIDTYLGQGRLDPFNIYPIEHVPLYVKDVLDHALNHKWAKVSPSDPFATKRGWLQCALSSPVAFYALSFAASQHLNYLKFGRDDNPHAALLRLSYKTEAVKLINRALTNLNGRPIPDSLLIAILSLGAHGHKPVPNTTSREDRLRGPKSPLASAQMIDFYGHIDQETAHMSALRTLLAHNKGVRGIKLPGLAGALALGDLLHSTITHQRPSLHTTTPVTEISCVSQFLPPVQRGSTPGCRNGSARSAGADVEQEDIVNTFPVSTKIVGDNRNARRLLGILTTAQSVTVALEKYRRDQGEDGNFVPADCERVRLEPLILARNYVHHALLDLHTANPLWGREFACYEALRVCGLIYSDLVLFPLPMETGVRGRYAEMLRSGMESVVVGVGGGGRGKEEVGFVLWGCVLGAVAAAELGVKKGEMEPGEKEGMEEARRWQMRKWFVAQVRTCAEMLGLGLAKGLEGWDEVREKVCNRYLWWDDVCDVVGQGVWEEVAAMQKEMVDRRLTDIFEETRAFHMLGS